MVVDDYLHLRPTHHELLWERRAAIQTKFKVQIYSPFNNITTDGRIANSDNSSDTLLVTVVGESEDITALKKYVNDVIIHPEIIEIFNFHQDLTPIFENNVWIEIFEDFHGVCISVKPDCELNICGAESSVLSAVSSMNEISVKYVECKDKMPINCRSSLPHKLVTALKACKDVNISPNIFINLPDSVITLLLSVLKEAYEERFPACDNSESLEDSVLIIDIPEKETDLSVIVIDSDSDNSMKCQLENVPKRKKSREDRKAHRKRLKENNRPLLHSDNGILGKNDVDERTAQPNGYIQCSKVECCSSESKLPIVENHTFIPLVLESSNDNKRMAEMPSQQAGQYSCDEKVKDEVEVIAEEVPRAPRQLRPVYIDGCNVAFYTSQGRREDFSWKRIEITLNYFLSRGHDVKVFLPQYRRPLCYEKSGNQCHVEDLENKQLIIFTPSRRIDGRTVSCYDDRFIVDLACRKGGIIFSNDNYRDLINENPDFAKTIKERLLMYVFVGDELMIPEDPLGKSGPRLDDFLAFPGEN